jgi:hypothetical protein
MSKAVPPTQVVSAGLAAAAAAFVTSRFGVAGTLLGAALTAMIITGGSAILRPYLDNVPSKVRARRERRKARRSAEPDALPERPDLQDNFMGRMRAAMGWFSQLPLLTRRSILVKGLIGALVAFVIGMGAVYGTETIIGNSLSCGLWSECPKGATPGTHLGGGDGTGASPTINLGRAKTKPTTTLQNVPQNSSQNTLKPQNSAVQQNTAPPKQQGLPQVAPSSRSEQTPSLPKPQEPMQPQTPQEEQVAPGEEPAVKPSSGEQTSQEQNPSSGGGVSAPNQQQGAPSGEDEQTTPSGQF